MRVFSYPVLMQYIFSTSTGITRLDYRCSIATCSCIWKTKPIILSDVTDVIWCVYLNFHEIDNNSQKFYPENLTFYNKGFIWKFSTMKIWSHTIPGIHIILCCQTTFSICICGGGKIVWWHGQYRVVSGHYDFHGMLIDKTNTTLIYILFVIPLFSDCQQSLMNTN